MSRLIKFVMIAILAFTVLSCEMFDTSAGSFQIKFQWPEEGKPDFEQKEYHLWVVLEQWKDGDDEKASIVMQTAPTKFSVDGKAKVDLSDVKYAEDLVIKVEIRGSTKTQDRVLYYGRSELFTFKSSDKNKEVKVKLQTQATPGTGSADESGISLKIVQNGKEVTKINDTVVSVRVRVVNGTKVIIANSLSILEQYLNDNSSVTDGVIEKPVAEMTEAGEEIYDLEGWDLNTGLAFSDSDGGERVVFGKLVNDEGYVSETIQATVAVDKTAPVIINPTVSPNPAKLDDVVTATFSFSEEIDPDTLELNWDGLGFVVDDSTEGSIIKYTYTVKPADEEKTYTLTGSAKDLIGNGPVEFQLGELLIDRTKPSVKNETVAVTDDKSSIRSGDTVTVTFEVSEEIEGYPQVSVDGKNFDRVGESIEPYEFTYLVSDSDLDGTKTILVSLTDNAGNSDVVELGTTVKFDLSAPEIVNPIVTPSGDPGLAALGSRIEIRFNISEEVEELKFFVNGAQNTDTFTESVDGLTYIYSRTVDSSDSAVPAYVFSVSAIDSAGNSLDEQSLGTVNVDVVKPEISTHAISKNKVKLLESFSVELNISEALSSVSLLVGSKDISSTCVASTTVDNQYLCTHIANKDDDEGDGVKQFSVMMSDLAGNSSTVQLKDGTGANETIEYDVTPPDVVNPVVAPEKANLDSTVDVRFSFTENVDGLVVDWGDLDGKFIRDNEETNKKLFIYKHKVVEADEEGVFPVTITAAFDEAGNAISGNILIGNVEIDNSAPAVFQTDIKVNDDSSRSYVVTDDEVKIIFEVHEEISDYTARIGLLKIETCSQEVVTEGTKYTCTYSTPSADDGEGTKDVTVEVKDLAGNAKSHPIGQLTFDMSDPEISSSIVIPEKVNLSSSDVQVKFSFSEDVSVLSEDVTMVADPGSADALALSCNTGTDYKKQFTCTATFDGADTRVADYAITIAAQDRAGNRVENLSVGTVSMDREKPTITESNVNPESVKSGEPFEISFTVNETLAAAPIVKVGDKELPGTECSETTENRFSCNHIANNDGDETDGTKSISVNLRDPAGNISTEVLAKTVSYDATRPTVINTIIIPESVANQYDSVIQVRFSFSETIDYPTKFDFKASSRDGLATLPTFSCSASSASNQSFICEGSYLASDETIDELTFSVKASDVAGNTLEESDAYKDLGSLEIDRRPAAITFGDVTPGSVNKSVTEVIVEFTVDEVPQEDPRVYLGSIMKVVPESSTPEGDSVKYTYRFTDLSELGDGDVSVLVEVSDPAGNISSNEYLSALVVDRTSPSVMTSSLSPKIVNKQTEELQISLTFSEPINSFTGADITSVPSVFTGWTCMDPDAGGQNFICSHDLSALTLSDVNYEFFVVADDMSGNPLETSPFTLGSILVDKTDPIATFTSVSPGSVNKASGLISVSFTASEELDRDPVVKIGSDLFSSTPASKSGLDYVYEFTDLSGLSDGNKSVEVVLTDMSGNEFASTYEFEILVDRTSPTVTPGGVAPAIANENTDNVTVFFSFSETVTGFDNNSITVTPSGVLTSYNCTNPTGDNQSFKCVFDCTASPAEGTYEFFVEATDDAGNDMESAPVKVGEVLLDTDGFEVTFDTVTPDPHIVNIGTGSITVIFTTEEVPGGNPVVKVGTELSSSSPLNVTNGGKTFEYAFSDFDGVSDGPKGIFLELEDDSGNNFTASWSGIIHVDRTLPSIISSSAGPDYVNAITDQISLSISFSEPVDSFSGTNITVSPSGVLAAFNCSTSDDQTFSCSSNTSGLTSAADGNYEFSALAQDVAGNVMSSTELIGDVTIDRDVPSFTVDTFTPAEVNSTSTNVSVTFTVSETLKANPKAILGSKVLTSYESKTGLSYTYLFSDLSGITDGSKSFNISFEDVAGNYFDNDVTGPVFDRTAPYVVAGGVAPSEVNNYTQFVNVSFTFSEPVDSFVAADISVSPSGVFPVPTCSDNDGGRQSFTCVYNISSTTLSNETYTFSVTAEDDFNNTIDPNPDSVGSLEADVDDPTATFTSVAPLAVNKATSAVTVSFNVSETLGSDPIVKIGSDIVSTTPKSNTGLDYVYEFTDLSGLSDGNKFVEVILTDTFGNEKHTVYGSEITVDRTSPTVTPGGVAPAVANDNTDSVTVFFSFSESVSGFDNTSLTVAPTGALTDYNCTNPTSDNQSFKCVFDLTTVSPADTTYEFFVEATDDAGNPMESAPAKVGEVEIDTQGVSVVFNSVTPASVNSGTGLVSVVFTTGEVPGENPIVKIGTELTKSSSDTVTNGGKTFTYDFVSLNSLTDGSKNIFVDVEDDAGNVVTETWSGTLEVDRTVPSIISSSAGPDYVNSGTDQISLSLSFSEPVDSFTGADITISPPGVINAFSCSSTDDQTFSCSSDSSGLTQTADGDYEFSAIAQDLAGNAMGSAVLVGDVRVDRKIPSFTVDSFFPAEVNSASTGVSVTFTVSETLKMNPKVMLGSDKVLTTYQSKSGLQYTYAFSDLIGISDGEKTFNISFEDVAGNFFDNDATGPVFDRTAPYVIAGGVAPGEVNTFTENVNVSFTFSEPVDSFTSSDVSISPSGIFPSPTCSDNDGNRQSFTCSYDISSTVITNGSYAFSVTAVDDFNNTIDPDPDAVGTLVADTENPVVTFNSVTPLVVNAETDFLNIVFTVDSTLEEDPDVFIGPDKHLDTPTIVAGNQYTYSVAKTEFVGIPDGEKVIRVEIRDQFGNSGVGFNPDNVIFDRTRPDIVNSFANPSPVNENTVQLMLEVNFSEPIDTYDLFCPPLEPYFESCSMDMDDMTLSCHWSMPPPATDIDGEYYFSFNGVDKRGNYFNEGHTFITLLGGNALVIDRTQPGITRDAIDVFTPGDAYKTPQIAKVGDKIITQLSFDEDLKETPTVRLGGREMSVHGGGGDCLGGICQFISTVIMADGDGSKTLTVEAEDANGNVKSDEFLDAAVFDVTAPEVTYESLSPEFATEGDEIHAVFYFSEDIEVTTLQISSTIPFTKDVGQSTDSNFYYRYSVTGSSAEGEFSFKVKATDPAGNVSYSDTFHEIGRSTIDLTPPQFTTNYCDLNISSGYTLPSGVKAGAAGHIINADCNFLADETLSGDPVLKIGGNEFTEVSCGGGYSNCYLYEIQGSEGDGYKVLTVEIEDVAGNDYFAYPPADGMTETQQIAFDFTPPQLVYYMVYRDPELAGSIDGTRVHLSAFHPVSKEAVNLNIQLFSDEYINPGNVTLDSVPGGLSLGSPNVNDHIVQYIRTIDVTDSGTFEFDLTWEDMLGNRSLVPIRLDWDIEIDNSGANANDIAIDKTQFIKIPYGSDSTGGLARYSLVGDAGAVVDPQVTMVAAYSVSGSFAGSAEVNANGSFSIPDMSSGNVEKIFINPIKRSGTSMMPEGAFDPNSDFIEVERMRYIATMGHKTAGSNLDNPNNWYETKTNSYSIDYVGTNTTFDVDGDLLGLNDSSPFESGTASKWIQAGLNTQPEASYRTAMCYDSKRGKVVLFGGQENYYSNQTWEWFDGKWSLAIVDDPEGDGEPEPMVLGHFAYDSKRGVCVYYGGADVNGIKDQTWEWNGRSWERIFPSDPEGDGDPIAIYGGGFAYDSYRNVMVLAAGVYGAASSSVYEYDGKSWKEMPEVSVSPSSDGGKMVYDKARRKMVFVGGGNQNDETLEYSGQTMSVVCGGTTGCTGVPETDDGMLAYDANRKVVVYFGGDNGSANTNTLREWNGTSWSTKSPSGDKPAIREEGSMVYHEGRKTVILYGGRNGSTLYKDTWEWNGTVWKRLSPMNNTAWEYPTAKTHYAAAYDEARNVLILHGGMYSNATVSNQTWEWNGYSWKRLYPSTSPYRYGHTLVFDTSTQKLLMFGGVDNTSTYKSDVYEWSGTNWVLRTPLSGSVHARIFHSATYDSVRNKMVIFGGRLSSGTKVQYLHEWDNATRTWVWQANWGPEARIYAGMAYDPVKQRSILFGGYSSGEYGLGDTWEYNGSTRVWVDVITNPWTWGDNYPGYGCPSSESNCWENSSGTEYPIPRYGQMMVYDPEMKKTVISGGMVFQDWAEGYYFVTPDSWAYDSSSTSWQDLDVINGNAFEEKTKIYFHKGYYDTTKNEIASWGGVQGMEDAQIAYTNTNILRTGASEVPSQMFVVGLDTVGLTEEHAWRDIESISLSVYAGATVYSGTDCAAVDGVILYVWANGRWQILDQSPSPKDSVSELVFSVNNPEIIRMILNGEFSELYFKIEAKSTAGCVDNDDPLLAVDYAEITVDIKEDSIEDRYYISTSNATWDDARIACDAMGMDLAVVTSQRESDLITSMFSDTSYRWIGLSEPDTEGEWEWVNGLKAWTGNTDGQGHSWTRWALNSSNELYRPADASKLNCAMYFNYLDRWLFYDYSCTNALRYVCEKRDYSYSGITGNKETQEEACKAKGGELVSINSEVEEEAMWPFVSGITVHHYIGLTNKSADIYTWNDGEVCWDGNTASSSSGDAYGFHHWGPTQPNGPTETCVVYWTSSEVWYDRACTYTTYGGICEF